MKYMTLIGVLAISLLFPRPAAADVVINEIFYHAPDDLDDLQWIELHNSGSQLVDVAGWRFTKGITFQFPANSVLLPNGFIVLCKDTKLFAQFYDAKVDGEFKKSLGHKGATLELVDAAGKVVDRVKYGDRDPWPAAADGNSASLERITPGQSGNQADNWSSSPLPDDMEQPAGTPRQVNASYSENFPPVISDLAMTPSNPAPGQPVRVTALIEDADGVATAELRYRVVGPGAVGDEMIVNMPATDGKNFSAELPEFDGPQLVRVRVRAVDRKKSERYFPSPNDLRPAVSFYVQSPSDAQNIPLAFMINTDPRELAETERLRRRALQPMSAPFGNQNQQQLQQILTTGLNISEAWFECTINQKVDHPTYRKLRDVFLSKTADRNQIIEEALAADDLAAEIKAVPKRINVFQASFEKQVNAVLPAKDAAAFGSWYRKLPDRAADPAAFVKRMIDIEGAWLGVNARAEFTPEQIAQLRSPLQAAVAGRAEAGGKIMRREIDSFEKFRETVGAIEKTLDEDLRQQLTLRQRRALSQWQGAQGSPIRPRLTEARPRAPRGRSAFIVVAPKTGEVEVFDFLHITERSAGYKVRFHKDHTWNGMTSAAVIFEYNDRFVIAEPLAYELYRRAGNAACRTDFVRLTMNDHLIGYHLVIEQVNGAFLRRNHLDTAGDLYKILWYGAGIENQHEKQNHPDHTHVALIELISSLNKTSGDEQWAVIEKNFNVDQVINYFAVNLVLSHWDGFFNNYFTYQDPDHGKWEIYPWDQDKTWGFHDASGDTLFFDMPVTFGMAGDRPPGGGEPNFNPGSWWRPGGYFSSPLLANPEFRKRYLKRVRQIAEEIYTEMEFFPAIDAMVERLRPEIPIRAKAIGEDPTKALARLDRNRASLKEHLVKRRQFLLEQDEIAELPR